jgi:hypothetical protein
MLKFIKQDLVGKTTFFSQMASIQQSISRMESANKKLELQVNEKLNQAI